MATAMKDSKERKVFKILDYWKKVMEVMPPEKIVDKNSDLFPLFDYLYTETRQLYTKMPDRKNGDDPFLHPLNIVLALKDSDIDDGVTLCAGLVHDYVEEKVDLYKKKHRVEENRRGIAILDEYEEDVFEEVTRAMHIFAKENAIPVKVVDEILLIMKLLTRHKRDFYYRSIRTIFLCEDEEIKEKALLIKLADRMHNIVTIECFNEQEQIYQCFKNLFILNNVKKYIIEKYGEDVFTQEEKPPIELLFKGCAKATYEAFFKICKLARQKGIEEVVSVLQLAFKKFELEEAGTREVTAPTKKDIHPIRLYKGIIHKYDYRLHHKWQHFEKLKESECEYSKKFFVDFNFSDKQIQAIIDYKDSYAMKEVIAYLIYIQDYFIAGFEYTNFFKEI